MKLLKVSCTDTNTSWHNKPMYFCKSCLESSDHRHLLEDWFIKVEPTNENGACASFNHHRRIKKES